MSKKKEGQPEINIGLFGHVDHGKTTLLQRLSGKWADTHSEEIKRGITIRLGYAYIEIRKCPKCSTYTVKEECPECNEKAEPVRKISFVDAPGHESLMATMLAGSAIIDAALLLVAANEDCPQPQTREHLMALEILGIKDIIIIQNKIDLVDEKTSLKNYNEIRSLLKDTAYADAPIIPVSAQFGVNIDLLLEEIEGRFRTPKREAGKDPLFLVARSFDVNKPGTEIAKLQGGVVGGTVIRGKLKIGDEIEIRPGRLVEEKNQKVWKPILSKIVEIQSGGVSLKEVVPGGSAALQTSLDPFLVKSDSLVGGIVGHVKKLPPVWEELHLAPKLLKRVVGAKEDLAVEELKMNQVLMLNVNSAATVGTITKVGKDIVEAVLKLPVCAEKGSRVAISRRIGNRFRLIGYGVIQ